MNYFLHHLNFCAFVTQIENRKKIKMTMTIEYLESCQKHINQKHLSLSNQLNRHIFNKSNVLFMT